MTILARRHNVADTWIFAIGDRFDTDFESGCVVTELPDELGNLIARDSDGVECVFNIAMVASIERIL